MRFTNSHEQVLSPHRGLFRSVRALFAASTMLLLMVCAASAATFTVTKTADTNDNVCDADCSLREAIVAANASTVADIINFDPTVFGNPQTITLVSGQL